jgi:hypothetical protein
MLATSTTTTDVFIFLSFTPRRSYTLEIDIRTAGASTMIMRPGENGSPGSLLDYRGGASFARATRNCNWSK